MKTGLSEKANEILDKLMTGDFYLRAIKTKRVVEVRLMQHGKRDKCVEHFEAYTDEMNPVRELISGEWLRFEGENGSCGIPSMKALVQKTFEEVELPKGYSLMYGDQVRKA